ncbi:MAG TPA: ABC transporter ATP-binding protein [Candidatus Limnocylindrales bacterium]|nr:ABC transporter ATP-binding protein [Candidatus Limnocylindrales bacterium]
MTLASPIVLVSGLKKSFEGPAGALEAIADLSLEIGPGQITGCVGPSGCGKTTLLRLIAGLDAPTKGSILIGGRSPQFARPAVVFQNYALLPWRNLLENVALPLEIEGVASGERHARAEEVLAAVGLKGFERFRPSEVSGGMQARTAIARALTQKADVLLLDEWTASVDEITKESLHALVVELNETFRNCVAIVTHSISEAALLCDHIVVLSQRPARIVGTIDIDLPRRDRLANPDHPQLIEARRLGRALLQQSCDVSQVRL